MKKSIGDILSSVYERDHTLVAIEEEEAFQKAGKNRKAYMKDLEKRMMEAASNLEFEEAAKLRDILKRLENSDLEISTASRKPPRTLSSKRKR